MARVNILRQIKTPTGWQNTALERDDRNRIKWPSRARFLIEWRESGRRKREAAGETPSEALEAQRRKRLDLEAKATGLTVTDPDEEKAEALPLTKTVDGFLKDIKTFRKKLTWQKYDSTPPQNPTHATSRPKTSKDSSHGASPRASTRALRSTQTG